MQSRIKQLEKIVPIEIDEEDTSTLRLKFPPSIRSGNYPVICENVKKAYGDHVVFHDVNLTIHRGEKVAFVGKNGEGKSTLVKCIMDEIPYEGKLTIGHNVQIGYFAQNQAQLLDENVTVFDTIDRVAKGDIRLKIRDILGAFMFGGEASEKKVKVLYADCIQLWCRGQKTEYTNPPYAGYFPEGSFLPDWGVCRELGRTFKNRKYTEAL